MRISSVDQYLQLDPCQLASTVISCPFCGRDHGIPYREIQSGRGVLHELPDVMRRCLGHAPTCVGLIYDRHIENLIETFVLPAIPSSIRLLRYPLGQKNHLLEAEDTLGRAAAACIDSSVEILIGAGSGVICDLTKLISDIVNRPSIICGTALSMNAYTSNTAVITENNFKLSKFVRVSDAVILDSLLLATAPAEMTLAGLGDLSARAICNADFRLSHLLKNTYFCPLPFQLTAAYEQSVLASAEAIGRADLDALETLSKAVLVSGYSMTMVDGETFPSSGAEHVLSHFWDLQHELFNRPKNLHGAQVAIGTLINLALYDFLRKFQPGQLHIERILRNRPSFESIQIENTQKFGQSGAYLNQVVRQKWMGNADLRQYLESLRNNWESTWSDLEPYITAPDVIRHAFLAAKVPTTLAAIHRTKQDALDALLYGNRYRTRFTILDLFWELGLFPDAAQEILDLSRVLME